MTIFPIVPWLHVFTQRLPASRAGLCIDGERKESKRARVLTDEHRLHCSLREGAGFVLTELSIGRIRRCILRR